MSLIGLSHLSRKDGVCQDSSDVKKLQNGWVVAAVADGLGSAKYSHIGSKLAVEEVLRFVETNAPDVWHDESLISLLRTAFNVALKKIKAKASQDNQPLRYYGTTLTSVIYNGANVVFGHVGDGGIISLSPYGDFTTLTIAQKGEEYNQTITLQAGPDNWTFGISNESVAALLLLTDGVYDVACPWLLSNQNQKIWVNYVRSFMDRNLLPVNTAVDFENAKKGIEDFLTSNDSKQITDDKTIVGIINTAVMPEVKPDEYYFEPDWQKLMEVHNEQLYGSKSSTDVELDNVASSEEKKEPVFCGDTENKVQPESTNAKVKDTNAQKTGNIRINNNIRFMSKSERLFVRWSA
jgi:serine/threonine protein phosphatase PrpC